MSCLDTNITIKMKYMYSFDIGILSIFLRYTVDFMFNWLILVEQISGMITYSKNTADLLLWEHSKTSIKKHSKLYRLD